MHTLMGIVIVFLAFESRLYLVLNTMTAALGEIWSWARSSNQLGKDNAAARSRNVEISEILGNFELAGCVYDVRGPTLII